MIRLLLLLAFLLLPLSADAATYYIDFVGGSDAAAGTSTATPWKHVKGMTGATGTADGHTPVNGDVFIFKGGVTWTAGNFPWDIYGGSGSASSVLYTTDHSWFTGGSFAQPVFDYNSTSTAYTSPMLTNATGGFWTFNDLKLYRCGPNLVTHDGACGYFQNITDFTIQNSTIEGYGGRSCFMIFNGTNAANYNFLNNDVSHCASFTWIASTASSVTFTTVNYVGNLLHDGGSQLGNTGTISGNHGDGFLHYFPPTNSQASSYIDRLTVCNNTVYGDWTTQIGYGNGEDMSGFIYIEGAIKNSLVCNNVVTMTPPEIPGAHANTFIWGDGWVSLRSYGNTSATNVWVFNNTFALPGTGIQNGSWVFTDSGWSNLFIYNNIMSSTALCNSRRGGAIPTGVSDYNEFRCPTNSFLGGWMSDGGHSIYGSGGVGAPNSNPQWGSEFSDVHLSSSSPGRGTGVNITTIPSYSGLSAYQKNLVISDRDGVARGATWDMGAYQFGAVPDTTPPAAPTGVQIQ